MSESIQGRSVSSSFYKVNPKSKYPNLFPSYKYEFFTILLSLDLDVDDRCCCSLSTDAFDRTILLLESIGSSHLYELLTGVVWFIDEFATRRSRFIVQIRCILIIFLSLLVFQYNKL